MATSYVSPRRAAAGASDARTAGDAWLQPATRRARTTQAQATPLAQALGVFSIGLGLVQLFAPRELSRFIGIRGSFKDRWVMRLMGLREIASGIGILQQDQPAPGWLQARVAGDLLDLAVLGRLAMSDNVRHERLLLAIASVLGVTALDIHAARMLDEYSPHHDLHFHHSVTVGKPVTEVYAFWRDFENLPRFMSHLESVTVAAGGRSHWKAKAPAGMTVEWTAETTEDVPNQRIAWRSVEGATVPNQGVVRFVPAPGDRGTEVHVELKYDPPAGRFGAQIAKLFGEEPSLQVSDDLRAFKQIMEVGEILRADSTTLGHRFEHRPAQPQPDKANPNATAQGGAR